MIDLEKLREIAKLGCPIGHECFTELLDHIAALEKDASRYRWLRDDSLGTPNDMGELYVTQHRIAHDDDSIDIDLFMDALDEAIDTAMSASAITDLEI